MTNEQVDALARQAMNMLDGVEQAYEEHQSCSACGGVTLLHILSYPMTDSAQFASANGL